MPRPAEFEQPRAVARAMELFWSRGYEATSVRDLFEKLQILPGNSQWRVSPHLAGLRPYEGMNITGVTGISEAQRANLQALGAVPV